MATSFFEFQQTDTAADDGSIAACSGASAATTIDDSEMEVGGSAGTGTPLIQIAGSTTSRGIHLESKALQPNKTLWDAGTWTVNLEIQTGATEDVDWSETHICRVNASGTNQETVGSA